MAQYWVYLNDEVTGPFAVEQLIRLRGFSRQTQVCVDDASGNPTHWISPAEIPELAHIFKAVEEHQALTSFSGFCRAKESSQTGGSAPVPLDRRALRLSASAGAFPRFLSRCGGC